MKRPYDEFEIAGRFDLSEKEKGEIRAFCNNANINIGALLRLFPPPCIDAEELKKQLKTIAPK